MQQNVPELILVQRGLHPHELALQIGLEFHFLLRRVEGGIFIRAGHDVEGHVIGLPQMIAADDALVHGTADLLVTVVFLALGRFLDLFLGERHAEVDMDPALGLPDTLDDALEVFLFRLYVFLRAGDEDFAGFQDITGLILIGNADVDF